MEIKDRLREIRRATGLSQVKFAKRIAISHSYIADMEHGKKPVNERLIRLIAAEFCININWFRTGNGEMYDEQSSVKIAEAISIFKSLDDHYQELAIRQLSTLAGWQMCNKVS